MLIVNWLIFFLHVKLLNVLKGLVSLPMHVIQVQLIAITLIFNIILFNFKEIVNTELARFLLNPTLTRIFHPIASFFLKSPQEGSQTQIMLAVDEDLKEVSGKYFSDCKEASISEQAKDDETAEWLWNKSMQIVGI